MGRLLTLFGEATASAPVAFAPDDISGLLIWLDLSDTATVFQDSARTTPATADGDPVGGITDKSGTGRHASAPSGAARPTLRTSGEYSIEPDGTDDTLSVASGITLPDGFSVVCRFRLDTTPAGDTFIMDRTAGGGLDLHFTSSRVLRWRSTSTAGSSTLASSALTLAQWYHIVATWNAADGAMVLYLDGVSVATASPASAKTVTLTPKIFGHKDGGSINGYLKHFLVYGRALTAGEVTQLYDEY